MLKRKRIIAFIIVAAIASAMLFSVIFVAREAEHMCSGVECPVCSLIYSIINNLDSALKYIYLCVVAFAFILYAAVFERRKFVTRNFSLISLKIKLTN